MNIGVMMEQAFASGRLELGGKSVDLAEREWREHPAFGGVYLKLLAGSADTSGRFSYHLVRIDPGKTIGEHIHAEQLETHEVIAGAGAAVNDGRRMPYAPGVVAVFESGAPHRVEAESEGLLLLAKFIPALC